MRPFSYSLSCSVLLIACLGLLSACEPKAKPVAPQPKQEINLIGDLAIDVNYDPSQSSTNQFDPSRDFANSVGIQLVPIKAGRFSMGSPVDERGRQDDEPQHSITISKSFHMSAHEVTQKQWQAVMQSRPWHMKNQIGKGDDYPATYITWADAKLFCTVLSRRESRTYRLPTEAEWEYACRAGTTGAFHADPDEIGNYTCFDGNANSNFPSEVGDKLPNAWGLFDMHGNVSEWCNDWYAPYKLSDRVSPRGPATGEYRVTRGGSWESMIRFCRSAYRAGLGPDARMSTVGFRIVLEHD